MNSLYERLRDIDRDYNNNTWWKTDYIHRPLHFTIEGNEIVYPECAIKKTVEINEKVSNIDDLLNIINKYPLTPNVNYTIRMDRLHKIKEPLEKLNKMIGLHDLKNTIVNQILYYIQDLHKITGNVNTDYMHTILYGKPGTGKTEVAKILADIFRRLSVLSNGTFMKATRDDFIAGYLGQTALKTKELIQRTRGGVLFIDEAYSLGNEEKRDSFSKEAIDTLNEALSDYRDNWMVIVAGYEKEIRNCLFSYNPGLESRFIWTYHLDDYNAEELVDIFKKILNEQGWGCGDIDITWFREKREKYFVGNGRDMEVFAMKCKIAYSRDLFGKKKEEKPIIQMKHIKDAFSLYVKSNKFDDIQPIHSMYL